MKYFKPTLVVLATLLLIFWIGWVLTSDKALLTHPKGTIASSQLDLIITMYVLMGIVVVPTFIALFWVAWKYSAKRGAKYDPDQNPGVFWEAFLWLFPASIMAVIIVITWFTAHDLDPFQPIKSDSKTMRIQVVALDWKWLFIYPEQEIATLNFVEFPEKTPIRFELTADSSPMNSFWIPELAGQIYSMTGMVTQLHIMADGPGEYLGRAAEINGEGYSKMLFTAKSVTQKEFDTWVNEVKNAPQSLNKETYLKGIRPRSMQDPVTYYRQADPELFEKILKMYEKPKNKNLNHQTETSWQTSSSAD